MSVPAAIAAALIAPLAASVIAATPAYAPTGHPTAHSASTAHTEPHTTRAGIRTSRVRSAVTIPTYANCPNIPQACIDAGELTLYHGNILAGHNYMGWAYLNAIPISTHVDVPNGPVAGHYVVTGHLHLNRQGGAFPDFRGADLVLQSCEGQGTSFSLLKRV